MCYDNPAGKSSECYPDYPYKRLDALLKSLPGRDKRHCLPYNLLMLLHSGWRNNVFDHVFWQRNKGKFEGATLMSQGPCGDAKLKDLARFFS